MARERSDKPRPSDADRWRDTARRPPARPREAPAPEGTEATGISNQPLSREHARQGRLPAREEALQPDWTRQLGTEDAVEARAATVREVMTPGPVTVETTASLVDAARTMRERDIGDVLVTEEGLLRGIVTDRDIVVRGVAAGSDSARVTVGEICSRELATIGPDEPVEAAGILMRERAVRRLPVVEEGRAVGIVSLGDIAVEREPHAVVADISAAPPNR